MSAGFLRCVVALALIGRLSSSSFADDLATLAKKEKERRAKIAKLSKVLTETDSKEGVGSVSVLAGSATLPSDTPVVTSPDEARRQSWKARADAARSAVVLAQDALAVMEAQLETLRLDTAPLSAAEIQDPTRLQKREAKLAEMIAQIKSLREVVVATKKALSEFETEARRSGVPPGWLR